MSDFTPEQVDRAAEALWFGAGRGSLYGWNSVSESSKRSYRTFAEKVLSAAGAPEKVAPAVDEAALIAVIARAECSLPVSTSMRNRHRAVGAAVAAYLRGDHK